MTCENCVVCGLVLDNHDYEMAMKCLHDAIHKVNKLHKDLQEILDALSIQEHKS